MLAALGLSAAFAAQGPRAPTGAGTATRAVGEYRMLEERLASLVAHADRSGLEALLAEDFTYTGAELREPLERSAFLASELNGARTTGIERLGVLELPEIDIVSFLERFAPPVRAQARRASAYVVDVWRHRDHRLLARYRSLPARAPSGPATPSGRY